MSHIVASTAPVHLEKASRWRIAYRLGRLAGVLFGVGTQALFIYTVVFLFLFLRYGGSNQGNAWFLIDFFLAVGFALPHSLLLAPPTQSFLKRLLPVGLIGCLQCMVTCLSLLILIRYWRSSPILIWESHGVAKTFILFGFYASWIILLYSIWLTGMGYQTGLTQWWYWMRKASPPPRKFLQTGTFRWMRHPVYLGFLGLIWFTPTMTADHAVLTGVWTVYVYLGSHFKDRRLLRYLGNEYYEYGRRVPGFPWIGIGPLRRFR
jgi:methanethiol S-methyltransferase